MAVKIFLTGVTGYIAGDAFSVLQSKHPEYEYAVLVRSEEKGDVVKKAYPGTRIVIGDLDNSDVLKQEASKADIVLHAADASDHEGAAKAIAAGMVKGHGEDHPGFWLHTGGTGILTWEDAETGRLGEHSDKEYNDWDGVEELTSLPDSAFHRNVDKIVLEAGTKHSNVLKTALVCPPTIYGRGRGPVAVRSRQAYELTKLILNEKYIPVIGAGKARWNHVHVSDLSQLFLLLVEAAAAQKLDAELWGQRGYYLCENGEHVWTELAEKIARDAEGLGFVKKLEKKDLARQAALDVAGFEAVSWGLNSRGKAERARKLLGWSPTAKSIEQEAPNIVKDEHARLTGGS
ncbi:hypothetical protein LTR91_018754 [Friedmanniomyces endolithicus]|uniref:NAD(P)-binding domain-containing protein n=1 Tax=Friedmanniomyces endolithicus TaxID=329885 RepID=A0AAN6HC13_9PEZI|nr:hypothetical protein LTR94_016060 [Friedmanniomyces endolithicus]KAK0777614.1 hypothetical protein LTR59_013770 [Friedmanniomyces endolithicus]KAK0788355.1 hypothetical protein LTR75_012587 [Friedmanniomyces endolithicus]KAK0883944.1 hypothetical protein LTR87_002422 [Friedmanniomyces endolithicus]KAK0899591.1 hypothetical protein LTR57_021017 [Friedmanniomyces endolithicus]